MSQHSNNHSGLTMAAMIHLAAVIPQLTSASDTHYPWLPDDADILDGPKLAIPRRDDVGCRKGPGLASRSIPTSSPAPTRFTPAPRCAAATTVP